MKMGFEVTPHAEPEKAFLVAVRLPESSITRETEHLDELERLAETAGAEIVGRSIQARTRIDGATYVGTGKARQVKESCQDAGANLLIFDNDLSPAQARNLEKILNINIIDRTELILDIFARHAKTQQSKIQVELAQLTYALPRLTRLWDHLSRQQGGIGTRGPGETQLEVDRRRIGQRMATLRRQLKKISQRKATIRKGRRDLPIVALVGYTNAGKSTLMRSLTGADVHVKDQLFATLDTTTRKIRNGNSTNGRDAILLVDTVGFIRRLPAHLVSSFEATLKDIAQADLYLHVVDVSHPAYEEHMAITDSTVRSIENPGVETIYVFNKIDILPENVLAGLKARHPEGLFVSARRGAGLDAISQGIAKFYYGRNLKVEVKIPAGDGKNIARIRSLLHDVIDTFQGDVCVLNGTIESGQMGRLESVSGVEIRYLF